MGATCAWLGDFRTRLDAQYGLLGVPAPSCVHDVAGDARPPELLMFFASEPWSAAAVPQLDAELRAYAQAAQRLLPVLDQPEHATRYLPADLQRFNAFLRATYQGLWPEALVDEVLTLLWQRRRQRRIFISYRRSESLAIARQLHDRYSRRSFDVFLDERSIEPGVDFQRELTRKLDDCDAVLLLVSPGLTASRWVRQEIQLAVTRRIGLLGVIWPSDGASAPIMSVEAHQVPLDRRLQLAPSPAGAEPRELTDAELAEVDRLLFTGRSEAIASRIRDLVDSATDQLAALGVVTWRADGDFELTQDGALWLGCVAAFRPELGELWSWWDARRSRAPAGILVLYPELDASDPEEIAFRAVCAAWGASVTPPVVLRTVHV